VAGVLGLDRGQGWCPLPGHDGMATIVGHVDWGVAYSCDCNQRGWYDRPCSDALCSLRTGQELRCGEDKLSAGTRWVYPALLTYEVGLLKPAHVELPHLVDRAHGPLADEARDLFALFLRAADG
jgi:hypothetical protein